MISTIGESKLKNNDLKKSTTTSGTPTMYQQLYWVALQILTHLKPDFIWFLPLVQDEKIGRKVKLKKKAKI